MANRTYLISAPAQRQVVRALLDDIIRGTYPAGACLPPERELCQTLSTSRTTLRESLRIIEEMGAVRSRRGSGVWVEPAESWYLEVLPFYLAAQIKEGKDIRPLIADILGLRRELIFTLLRLVGPKCRPGCLDDARTLTAEAWAARESYSVFVERTLASWRACALAVDHRPALWVVNSLQRVFAAVGDVISSQARVPRGYLEVHMKIYTLLERGDADAAIGVMRPYYERHDELAVAALD